MIFSRNKNKEKIDKKKAPGLIAGCVVLVLFALATAFAFNHISPHGIALFGQWDPKKGVVSANPKKMKPAEPGIEITTSKQVKEIILSKRRMIIDVRPREMFDAGHIPTALSFPLEEFDISVPEMTGRINRSDPVLVYCSSIYCTDSHTFADYLKNMGYKDIKIFSGGYRQWEEEGNQIETNEN